MYGLDLLLGWCVAFLLLQTPQPAQPQAAWNPTDVRTYLERVSSSVQGGTVEPHWLDDGSRFWYAKGVPDQTEIYLVDPEAGTQEPLFDHGRLRRAVAEALGHAPPYEGVPFHTFDWDEDEGIIRFTVADERLELDLATYAAEAVPPPTDAERDRETPRVVRDMFPITGYAIREERSPDGRWFATLLGNDLGLRPAGGGETVRLTRDGSDVLQWYFGPDIMEPSGSPWSPGGTHLVARTLDVRAVPGFPLVDWLSPTEQVRPFRYWAKAGQPLPVTELYVFDVLSQQAVHVDAGDNRDAYVVFLGWNPEGSEFYFYRATRDFTRMEVMAADKETGESRLVLTEERDDGFVEFPWNGIQNLTPLSSGDRFIWGSDRSGWAHLYLYHRGGTLIRPLTEGAFPVGEVVGVDEEGGWVYFTAQSDPERPYDEHLHRTRLDGGGAMERLTEAPGQRRVTLAPSKRYFLDTHSALDRPPKTELRSVEGERLRVLAEAVVDTAFRAGWSAPEAFTATAADGVTRVHGVLFKPHHFDPGKRYPVVERIYGAMQASAVPRGYFGFGQTHPGAEYTKMIAYLNELGFAVVVMDTPGTPGRGRAFNMRTYGTWPEGVVADHVAALKDLARSRPYLDLDRVGVDGNSWGGYMATRAMIDAPDFYKAAAASVPETDFYDHVAWIEFQLGTPGANKAAYEAGSNLDKVDRIEGPLLLIGGTSDVNVTFSSVMKLVDALAEAQKRYELIVFPGTNHAHQGTGDRYSYAVNAIGLFFAEHLRRQAR